MNKTDRHSYFGCHLTKEQRAWLKAEAKRRKMSMSKLAALFIATGLAAAGVAPEIEPEKSPEVDVPLPLEV